MNIESIENLVQLGALGICAIFSAHYYLSAKCHEWAMLFLASLVYFLGDLYMQLYLIFFGETPNYSQIPYFSWYASYIFLSLLILEFRGKDRIKIKNFRMCLIPAFTVLMAIFFMLQGDYIGNTICAVTMAVLIWQAVEGLITAGAEGKDGARLLYITILALCLTEYTSWTVSSLWSVNSIANPYFWTDSFLSLIFLFLPFALRKAVDG